MEEKIDQLWDLLDRIPEEIVERLGLDEMLLDGDIEKAEEKIKKIITFREKNQPPIFGYHTTHRKYEVGDHISPQDSFGKYKGKVFVSRSLETAFVGDYPKRCYLVQIDGWFKDSDDLTGRNWGYTITPARVIEEVPMGKVFRAKSLQPF